MQKGSIAILFTSMFLVMAGFAIIFPILPFFSMHLGATPFQIGMLMASYSLMQFIFSPIWGSLSDRFGRKPIILIGLAGFALTFVLFGLANSLPMLFFSRIAGGILSSACLPTAMAYIADTTTPEERGGGMGMMGAAMGLGMIVGPAIGGIFSAFHFGAPFFLSAGVAAINFIFAVIFLKESKKPHDKAEIKFNYIQHIISLEGYMLFIFCLVFLMSYSMSGYESTYSLLANARLNYGSFQMGILFTIMGLIGVVIQGLLMGRLVKWLGEEKLIKYGLLISMIGFGLTAYAFNGFTIALFMGLAVVGWGLMRPSLASLVSKNTKLEEGATMGLMNSVDSLGRIVGPLAAGYMFQLNMGSPYISSGLLNLIALLAAMALI